MTLRRWSSLVVLVCIAGCSGAVAPTTQQPATLPVADSRLASVGGTLPFRTLVSDSGHGSYFAAGTSETIVLRSRADLDAFVARHTLAVAPGPVPSGLIPPSPHAGVAPPPAVPGPGIDFRAAALPDALLQLDFGKYEAIAFFDGSPTVATTSRITAVQEGPDGRLVATQRWNPPPNPAAVPDVNGRLHVIALERSDAPVRFTPLKQEVNTSPNGGYSVGGNPTMFPRWPAVPNPDLTRDVVTQLAHGFPGSDGFATMTLDQVQLSTLDPQIVANANYTPDSLVWVAKLQGALDGSPVVTQRLMVISIEDGRILDASTGPATAPALQAVLKASDAMHLGDKLTFDVQGTVVPGQLGLTISAGDTTLHTEQVPNAGLAAYQLPLDAAHLQDLPDSPFVDLTIKLQRDGGTETRHVHLLRDPATLPEPPLTQAAFVSDFSTPEAFARTLVTRDWHGQDLTLTSRPAVPADIALDNGTRFIAPWEPARTTFEFTGTFPTFYLSANTSGTGAPTVTQPTHVRIVLSNDLPCRVFTERGSP